jgi:hypothetical protein
MGLFVSRDAGLIVAMLEAHHHDPSLPANHILLLSELRVWSEWPALETQASRESTTVDALREARLADVRQAYMASALASLPQRTGDARRLTALALLQLLGRPSRQTATASVSTAVRQAVVEEFAGFGEMDAGSVLQNYWPYIRGPEMLPHVVRLAASATRWVRAQALGPLAELDADRARPIVVAEMLAGRTSMSPTCCFACPMRPSRKSSIHFSVWSTHFAVGLERNNPRS